MEKVPRLIMKTLRDYFEQQKHIHDRPVTGDLFALNMREECLLESEVIEHDDESITLLADNQLMQMLESYGAFEDKMIDVDGTDVDQYDYDTEEEVAEGSEQQINDYDTWSDKVSAQGGEIHPQKDRVRMVAQSWSGDTIGEFNLRTNQGYIIPGSQGVAEESDDKADAKERLAQLEKQFDSSYEYSDDHSVWKKHNAIRQEMDSLKKIIGQDVSEEKQKGVDGKACWKGYKRMGTKQKGGKTVDNCVPMGEDIEVQEQEMSRLRELAGMRQSMCNECGMSESNCGCEEPDPAQSGEYDFEGDMAKDDLYNIVKAARRLNGMLDDNENMPEWVQSKINKAEDYLDVAADYIEANKARDQVDMDEAKYQGREVQLNKPTAGDVGKFKVYVKDPSTGNVKKVNFGDKTMRIKKSNPARRKSFRARHRCENPGPKTKARYWSCRKW
jgi:hypothetical protein